MGSSDIKAENFMLQKPGVAHPLKLIDFGLACRFRRNGCMTDRVGTLYSMAPEIMRREPYTENCDVWSLGCVVFELCVGHAPYIAPNLEELTQMISEEEVTFVENVWKRHPPEIKQLVQDMC